MYLIKLNLTVSLTCTFFGFCFSLNQPAGLAKSCVDKGGSTKKEGLDPGSNGEEKSGICLNTLERILFV